MELTASPHRLFIRLFMMTISASFIVFMEPAPYDVLLILVLAIAAFNHYTVYSSIHFWPILCLLLFLGANIFSFIFTKDITAAGFYLLITVYCMVSWVGMVGIVSYFQTILLPFLFNAYTTAALLAVIPGIIAYSSNGAVLDMFLWEGSRVQGLFKDPNVFGPFLVSPALYALWCMGRKGQPQKIMWIWTSVFLVLAVGILISFSRAAWGQFLLAIGIYFLLLNDRSTRKLKTLFVLIMIFVPVFIYIVMTTNVGDLFFERISMQGYDETRFAQQESSINYMAAYPFGFGPGQSEYFLSQSTHNLYIRLFSENGLLGLLFFSGFYLLTVARSLYLGGKVPLQYKGYFIIITTSLLGVAFNSLFIDTMHWRHFWLLLVLPWMAMADLDQDDKLNT